MGPAQEVGSRPVHAPCSQESSRRVPFPGARVVQTGRRQRRRRAGVPRVLDLQTVQDRPEATRTRRSKGHGPGTCSRRGPAPKHPSDQELDTELWSLQPLLLRPQLLSDPGPRTTYLVAREFHRERLGPALQLHRHNLGSTLRSLWPELAGSCTAQREPDRESSDPTFRHWGTLVPPCSADRKGG